LIVPAFCRGDASSLDKLYTTSHQGTFDFFQNWTGYYQNDHLKDYPTTQSRQNVRVALGRGACGKTREGI
jgi:hypothetical protein